jgi:hypothetical protein
VGQTMKSQVVTCFTILVLLCPFYAVGSDFEDSVKNSGSDFKGANSDFEDDGSNIEDESTPIEQEDMKTVNEISGDTSFENESTPIEKEDIKTIDQINKPSDY